MNKYNRIKEKISSKEDPRIHNQFEDEQIERFNNISDELYSVLDNQEYIENSNNKHDNVSDFINLVQNQLYWNISYNFFHFIDKIKEYYWDLMTTEDFWSKNGANFHNILSNPLQDLETEIWLWLTQYISYYIKDAYSNNILDDEIIKSITPKFIKSIIYYKSWIETLWEVLQNYSSWSDSGIEWDFIDWEKTEYRHLPIYLESSFRDYLTVYNIKDNHLSWLSILHVQRLYSRFINKNETQLEEWLLKKCDDQVLKKEYDGPETYIMKDFQRYVLDKILIPSLRHTKTDYDICSFDWDNWEYHDLSWYTRSDARRFYNQYCRSKYLYNDIKTKSNEKWETIEYIPVWIDEFDSYWDFWRNTTTDIFDFYGDDESIEEDIEQFQEVL